MGLESSLLASVVLNSWPAWALRRCRAGLSLFQQGETRVPQFHWPGPPHAVSPAPGRLLRRSAITVLAETPHDTGP